MIRKKVYWFKKFEEKCKNSLNIFLSLSNIFDLHGLSVFSKSCKFEKSFTFITGGLCSYDCFKVCFIKISWANEIKIQRNLMPANESRGKHKLTAIVLMKANL